LRPRRAGVAFADADDDDRREELAFRPALRPDRFAPLARARPAAAPAPRFAPVRPPRALVAAFAPARPRPRGVAPALPFLPDVFARVRAAAFPDPFADPFAADPFATLADLAPLRPRFAGTFTPARRAFDSPIAIACLRERGARFFPSPRSCISSRTNSPAAVVAAFPSRCARRARLVVCLSGMDHSSGSLPRR
jgi:hypothetical protein